ncbi:phosphoribosylaminoimidazole carboxylase ATPase subunit [Paucilactobacillus hokkaidonensis JCM 18461]|uniref:Phosphoribosylaminoimidazole carboxylase ATPase subunit n=2 Tax=Paucilactobacillus hokkaidonensis TaxID=1193095 RepID=A0A0A1GWH0_9LACO|nr:ATP-grasp domain-containing protein [Paucilactobacillus hokkaidonensis]KRO11276.1 phosphoribosylaminoimidazole carboxylase ATPase subunit PurK [Paucilactobacillus hokkaidonensis]BAP85173.1 phosphoribosylaminoimidazole carboxylase ATPase subunit [Paucilactobacillus hokkaidonensis JCM 18461]
MSAQNNHILYPGKTLGIIGNGFIATRLTQDAQRSGFKVGVYGSQASDAAMKQADFETVGALSDRAKLKEFSQECDAVTYVGANVDAQVIEYISQYTWVPQGKETLEVIQDRLLERAFFDQINVNIAPYVTVIGLDDLYQSIDSIGYPAVLKPIQRGLGERSMIINKQSDITKAADFLETGTYVLESYIPHDHEFSLMVAKGQQDTQVFPLMELKLKQEQLIEAAAPAKINEDVLAEIMRIGTAVAQQLTYVGVLEIGFYLTKTGTLYVKGVTPGLTTQGNVFDKVSDVSQYEEHLRAIIGIPLQPIKPLQPSIMMMIQKDQMDDIQTQWLLKDNWRFTFYQQTPDSQSTIAGHVLVAGDELDKLQLQVDNTEVWNKRTRTNNKEE